MLLDDHSGRCLLLYSRRLCGTDHAMGAHLIRQEEGHLSLPYRLLLRLLSLDTGLQIARTDHTPSVPLGVPNRGPRRIVRRSGWVIDVREPVIGRGSQRVIEPLLLLMGSSI